MDVIAQLSSSQGLRDDIPNQKLAKELVATKDSEAINVLAEQMIGKIKIHPHRKMSFFSQFLLRAGDSFSHHSSYCKYSTPKTAYQSENHEIQFEEDRPLP